MARTISVYRRRPGLIDMNWPVRANVGAYALKSATNFNGTFTTFATVPASGFASASIGDLGFGGEQFRGKTRVAINLADYTLDDTKPLWLRVAPVSLAGVEGSVEAIHLILPYSSQPRREVLIVGTVAEGTTIANSVEIQLPNCTNPNIQNNGTPSLYVAFDSVGPEFEVPSLQSGFTNYYSASGTFSQIFLRAGTGGTSMSAQFVLRNESF